MSGSYNPMTKVHISYIACTMPEAWTEINIQLRSINLSEISQESLISTNPTEHDDDWFEDYTFTFEANYPISGKDLKKLFEEGNISFDYEIIEPTDMSYPDFSGYNKFELAYLETSSDTDNDDSIYRYYITGSTTDTNDEPVVLTVITITKHGDFVIDWRDHTHKTDPNLQSLIDYAKRQLTKMLDNKEK